MNCKETKCFSERLRLLLYEREIKVTELAKVIGRERQTIHNYISGHSEPRLTDIIRIAKHFGVTPDYLLGIEEKPAIERVKQEWISVEDRLPEDDLPKDSEKKQIDVLVAIQREDDYGWLVRSQTRVKDKFWTDTEPEWNWGTHPRGEVTHWMPLPEPPKRDGD